MPGSSVATLRVDGVREVLRSLRRLPKELNRELRAESKRIATTVMVPAWQRAAAGAGPYGGLIAGSIRSRSDRMPAVVIGKRRPKLSRGIDSIMARYPSQLGQPGVDGVFDFPEPRGQLALATFYGGKGWMDRTGAHEYGDEATRMWGDALEGVVARWNAGLI